MHMIRHSFVLMLALLSIVSACTKRQPATQQMSPEARKADKAARQEAEALPGKLATLPPECTFGSARQVRGAWTMTEHTETTSIQPTTTVFTFGAPVRASAFRVAFNPDGLRALDKIELRDADGSWRLALSGVQPDVPAGCEYVLLQQTLESGPHHVAALRISFHSGPSKITAGVVSVLQDTPQAAGI